MFWNSGVCRIKFAGFIRGGNWNNGANDGAFTLNLNNAPSNSNTNIGFRCARYAFSLARIRLPLKSADGSGLAQKRVNIAKKHTGILRSLSREKYRACTSAACRLSKGAHGGESGPNTKKHEHANTDI